MKNGREEYSFYASQLKSIYHAPYAHTSESVGSSYRQRSEVKGERIAVAFGSKEVGILGLISRALVAARGQPYQNVSQPRRDHEVLSMYVQYIMDIYVVYISLGLGPRFL